MAKFAVTLMATATCDRCLGTTRRSFSTSFCVSSVSPTVSITAARF
uniref:Uncharacterized protein n=1 Tax=Arundo donax TaxID=35708 RepID=A0A0A8ZBF6_ARUDO